MWSLLALLLALPSLRLDVTPLVGMAPLTIRVRTTIELSAANRTACVYYVSDVGGAAQSCWGLDGANAARTTTRYYLLEGGDYLIGLRVDRADRTSVTAPPIRLRVIPRY